MKTNIVETLASRTKLTTLSLSCWRPKKLHRRETAAENMRHGLSREAEVRVLLCDHPALQKVLSLQAAQYVEHDRLTLPTIQKGFKLLPAGREMEHARVMTQMHDLQEKLWAEFIGEYPAIMADAPRRFKSLYDPSLWPPVDTVKAQWACEVKYLPCPTQGPWGQWLAESAKAGQEELQDRLVSAARRLIERCGGDGKLYETVLSELRDICDLVPDLDLMDDPIIRRAAQELRPLTTASIDTLRESKTARKDTAEAAKRIVKMLNLGA